MTSDPGSAVTTYTGRQMCRGMSLQPEGRREEEQRRGESNGTGTKESTHTNRAARLAKPLRNHPGYADVSHCGVVKTKKPIEERCATRDQRSEKARHVK